MFDIGASEIFVVIVVAIMVVGPKDLPKFVRSIMGVVRKVRGFSNDFKSSLRQMADEVELDDVTRKLNEAGNIPLDETPTILPDPPEGDDEK